MKLITLLRSGRETGVQTPVSHIGSIQRRVRMQGNGVSVEIHAQVVAVVQAPQPGVVPPHYGELSLSSVTSQSGGRKGLLLLRRLKNESLLRTKEDKRLLVKWTIDYFLHSFFLL